MFAIVLSWIGVVGVLVGAFTAGAVLENRLCRLENDWTARMHGRFGVYGG